MPNCPICKGQCNLITYKKFNWQYNVCLNCGFIFKQTALSEQKEKQIYLLHNNSFDDAKYIAYFQSYLNFAVLPYINIENADVLDFGCGHTPVLASILRNKYKANVKLYDKFFYNDKSYINCKYDLIVSTEVAEHIDNPNEYFRHLASLLKSNGLLAIMTSLNKLNNDDFLKWHYIREECHISFYTLKSLELLASNIGLKIIYCNNNNYISFKK